MGIFGWSLPPGCGTLPGEEEEPKQPRCRHCKAFLKNKPDSATPWEATEPCDGRYYEEIHGTICGKHDAHEPHTSVIDSGVTMKWLCARCGKETAYSE